MRMHATQLAKFSLVGSSGYAVNIAVYATLVQLAGFDPLPAAACSFLTAAASNYALNRVWTFRQSLGSVTRQGLRFLIVSTVVGTASLLVLTTLRTLGLGGVEAQALAVIIAMPLSFTGNRIWSFRDDAGPGQRRPAGAGECPPGRRSRAPSTGREPDGSEHGRPRARARLIRPLQARNR